MDAIDVHVHVFDRLSDQFPRTTSDLAPADREARAETLLTEMDNAGVQRAVLIDMGGPALEHHRYVTHCVERWPDRFTATGLVDIDAADPPGQLRRLAAATRIEGIRLGRLGDPSTRRVEDLAAYGLFAAAAELQLNINVYGGPRNIPCIALLAAAFPRVAISLDHLGVCPSVPGGPDRWRRPRFATQPLPPTNYAEVLALAQFPNVYVKVSGEYAFSKEPYPYADMRPMVEQVLQAFGPERLMWCSDFPWIVVEPGYGRLAQLIDHHLPGLGVADRALIMGGNALKLWFRR